MEEKRVKKGGGEVVLYYGFLKGAGASCVPYPWVECELVVG
jgi:hypothetical protein